MYTEDDDKVVVNNDSNSDYANFYTSFINDEKGKKKNKTTSSKEKKNNNKVEPKEEDYSDFYSSFMENERKKKEENSKKNTSKEEKKVETDEDYELKDEDDYSDFYNNDNNNRKSIIKVILFALGIIILVALIVLLIWKGNFFGKGSKADIVLTNEEINVKVGENSVISYSIVNTDKEVTSTFTSSNEDVAIVDNNGMITGITSGEAEITIRYTIDGNTKEKKCKVIVSGEGSVDKNVTLDVKIENATDNVWTKKDVNISVNAKSVFGIEYIRYAINCEDNNCKYEDVKDNKITVTENGINKVNFVAQDRNKQQTQKLVTIKIDKESPEITLNESTSITSNKDVTVCATCKDNISGCKQERVCKKFTSSKSNQKLVIEDVAGNQTYSPSFNVKINKVNGPCELSVSKDGVVTAGVMDGATYYGFSSTYSGKNSTSQKVDISTTQAGERKAKIISYYVKDSKGTKHSCSIMVIKECNASNVCTFSSN